MACVVSALEFIHSKKIAHTQLKLTKLIFDDRGYLHLTDFSKAKFQYTAPLVDYYALGFMTQECFLGDAVSITPLSQSKRNLEHLPRLTRPRTLGTLQIKRQTQINFRLYSKVESIQQRRRSTGELQWYLRDKEAPVLKRL